MNNGSDDASPFHPTRPGGPRSGVVRLGWFLVLALVVAWLFASRIGPGALAALHLFIAAAAVQAATLPDSRIAHARRAWQLAIAGLAPLAAMTTGLIPLPTSFLSALAPGIAKAHPQTAWHTLSTAPELTVTAIGYGSILWCFAVLVALWATTTRTSRRIDSLVIGAMLVVEATAALHAAGDIDQLFGTFGRPSPRELFFAPFINPNHLGTALILGFPIAAGRAADGLAQAEPKAMLGGLAAIGAIILLIAAGSPGALAAFAVMTVVWASSTVLSMRQSLAAMASVGAAGAAGLLMWVTLWEPTWLSAVASRATTWSDAVPLLRDHPLGVGAGAFVEAFPPYRSWPTFETFTHAHNDWLQWVVETGTFGVVALVVMAALLPRPSPQWRVPRTTRIEMGLVGFGVHALIDFPIQIYPIALAAAGLVALRLAAFDPPEESSPRKMRILLGAMVAIHLPFAVWQQHAAVTADAAARIVDAPPGAAEDADWLRSRAPWRPEWRVYDAWRAQLGGDAESAKTHARAAVRRHPDDASTLRRMALVLARFEAFDEADEAFERALLRSPTDYRNWGAWSASLRQRDPERAATLWARAITHWPYDPNSRAEPLRDGYAAFPNGLWWLTALEASPGWWSERFALLMLEVDEPNTALLAYEQAALLDEAYEDWPPRARAMAAIGDYAAVDTYLRDLTTRNPDGERAWLIWADLLLEQRRGEEALMAYQRALDAFPTRARSKVGLVRASAVIGGPEAGIDKVQQLEIAGQLESVPEVRLEQARLYARMDDWYDCVRTLDDHHVDNTPALRDGARRLREQCFISKEGGRPQPIHPPRP